MITDLKEFKPTKEMINAAERVCKAMAYKDTIKPIVRKYQKAVLEKYQFHIDKIWIENYNKADRIVLEPEDDYLLNDNDFKIVLKEWNKERKKVGLHIDNEEYCPLLIAEDLLNKAEKLLLDEMEYITGMKAEDFTYNNEIYNKAVDLTLKLLVPFIDKEKLKKEFLKKD